MSVFKIVFAVLLCMIFGVIEANAGDQSICATGAAQVFYPNGSLKSCVLKDPFRSNEIKCSSQSQVSFYDNGQLETCILAEPAAISGQKCKEFGLVSFYPDGKFRSCVKTD